MKSMTFAACLVFMLGCAPAPADIAEHILVPPSDSGVEASMVEEAGGVLEAGDDGGTDAGADANMSTVDAMPTVDAMSTVDDAGADVQVASDDAAVPVDAASPVDSAPPVDAGPPVATCVNPAWTWSCGPSGCITSATCTTPIAAGWYVEFDTGSCEIMAVPSCSSGTACAVVAPGPTYYAGTCQ